MYLIEAYEVAEVGGRVPKIDVKIFVAVLFRAWDVLYLVEACEEVVGHGPCGQHLRSRRSPHAFHHALL